MKVPKLFGRISGDITSLFIFKAKASRGTKPCSYFIPFTPYKKTSFTNGFSVPKSFRDFRETGAWCSARGIAVKGFEIATV